MALLGIAGAAGTSSVMRILGTDLPHNKLVLSHEASQAPTDSHGACSLMLWTSSQRTAFEPNALASCTGWRQKKCLWCSAPWFGPICSPTAAWLTAICMVVRQERTACQQMCICYQGAYLPSAHARRP